VVSFRAGTRRFGATAASRCGEAVDEQVLLDGAVYFGEALLAVAVGLVDQGPGLVELAMMWSGLCSIGLAVVGVASPRHRRPAASCKTSATNSLNHPVQLRQRTAKADKIKAVTPAA
jgi:hypothetical protein